MSKKRAIIWSSVFLVILLFFGVFTFTPLSNVGKNGVYDYVPPINLIRLGLDLKGGMSVTYEIDTELLDNGTISASTFADNISETAKSLQRRLSAKGFTEAVVTSVSGGSTGYAIKVEIPDVSDTAEVFDILSKPAVLKIYMADSAGTAPDYNKVAFDASNIESASAYYDTSTSGWAVSLTLNTAGQKQVSDATINAATTSTKIYFMLDGQTISNPTVSTHINGKYSSITGLGDDAAYAQTLALQINSGAYAVSFSNIGESRTIGARLGEDAIRTTLISGVIILALICLFMIVIYGFFGIAASFALLFYTIMIILALAFIPFAQLTLPGIAGIIIGIGMAVDANIIIFERIKDEYKLGRSFDVSITNGFKASLSAILDSNITTLIGGIVLYIVATGPIQGFAITLIFSIVLSLFSSLVLTRLFIKFITPFTNRPSLYKLKEAK